jgi:hypothetical protein
LVIEQVLQNAPHFADLKGIFSIIEAPVQVLLIKFEGVLP